ncbi:Mu-like prophage major head subunit gpT family protein [Magnetococcus sp. PR-3]|uniref:Mu-like prophage major head subunit gpT family protein n=1 Tax=Magnetococcus sp. PR-3 TaxID=3120355 RepID=UPI002FCE0907
MLVNGQTIEALEVGFKTHYINGGKTHKSWWQKVAMEVPSTGAKETYGWLKLIPGFREWIGDKVIHALSAHDFDIINKAFEMTVGVQRTDIEDDKLGKYKIIFEELGRAAEAHPDELMAELVSMLWSTLCYDGQPMIDTDHPVVDAMDPDTGDKVQTWSNNQGGSGKPWLLLDTSRAIKPLIRQPRKAYNMVRMTDEGGKTNENTFMRGEYLYGSEGRGNVGVGVWQMIYGSKQTLNAANYEDAKRRMKLTPRDGGKTLKIKPTLLVTGPSNEAAAKALFKTDKLTGGASNPNFNDVEMLIVDEMG